jgi:Mg2+ and Co2+ transporter CorA
MLINFSNHNSSRWKEKQKQISYELFNSIVDIEFPSINPEAEADELEQLLNKTMDELLKIIDQSNDENKAIHIMGEMTFSFRLVTKLKERGIRCIASTTERRIEERDGLK